MFCTWWYTIGMVTTQASTDTVANATEQNATSRRERLRGGGACIGIDD